MDDLISKMCSGVRIDIDCFVHISSFMVVIHRCCFSAGCWLLKKCCRQRVIYMHNLLPLTLLTSRLSLRWEGCVKATDKLNRLFRPYSTYSDNLLSSHAANVVGLKLQLGRPVDLHGAEYTFLPFSNVDGQDWTGLHHERHGFFR